ncbi:beta-class carbonic anhydrase [Dethiothermospora halolimnae]|uniref:beta-class carbonic anhydrase n=1 Tax=Dethiothermospora halolimnae TaxID=3114390 RepID=UPI003CCBB8C7
MSLLDRVLEKNKSYVKNRKEKGREEYLSSHAKKEALILTCMDTRLVGVLEEAMGFKRGEVKVLKNAGNTIRDNCSDVIRSISLGTIMMGLKEVFVVGHRDCGMTKENIEDIKKAMLDRGIEEQAINKIDLLKWTGIIDDEKENVIYTVDKIKKSPFIPTDIKVHGLLIDTNSLEIEIIVDGNKEKGEL